MGIGVEGLEEAARLWVEAGGGRLPVSGASMAPTFQDASRIRIEPAAKIRFGDVLVYRTGAIVVVHRVVGFRTGARYRTKGDGRPQADPDLVTRDSVLGSVVEIGRGGVRYRTDRRGGRLYARIIAGISAAEGLFYRAAWRGDRLLGLLAPWISPDPASGLAGRVTLLRRAVRASGRGAIGAADSLLFRALHTPAGMV